MKSLSKQVDFWVQKGYELHYLITDQSKNDKQAVEDGSIKRFTYMFVIDFDGVCIWDYSVDSIEEGYILALEWLSKFLLDDDL